MGLVQSSSELIQCSLVQRKRLHAQFVTDDPTIYGVLAMCVTAVGLC